MPISRIIAAATGAIILLLATLWVLDVNYAAWLGAWLSPDNQYISGLVCLIVFGFVAALVYTRLLGNFIPGPGPIRGLQFGALLAVCAIWVLPAVLGQPFLRLYLLAEHGRCPFVANMLENSRTTLTNALVRWVAWNMPYHAEHHSWPGVPFHRLPDLHELTRAHLGQTENGYARFHRKYVGALARPREAREV